MRFVITCYECPQAFNARAHLHPPSNTSLSHAPSCKFRSSRRPRRHRLGQISFALAFANKHLGRVVSSLRSITSIMNEKRRENGTGGTHDLLTPTDNLTNALLTDMCVYFCSKVFVLPWAIYFWHRCTLVPMAHYTYLIWRRRQCIAFNHGLYPKQNTTRQSLLHFSDHTNIHWTHTKTLSVWRGLVPV